MTGGVAFRIGEHGDGGGIPISIAATEQQH
jgi:hypothetical protein